MTEFARRQAKDGANRHFASKVQIPRMCRISRNVFLNFESFELKDAQRTWIRNLGQLSFLLHGGPNCMLSLPP